MATIFTKRWDDPPDPADGTRILVCRYRPRALRKSDETWSKWFPDLGPSKDLHAAAYGKGRDVLQWTAYRVAYLREMRGQTAAIAALADLVRGGETITLLCSSACVRESRCHRSLLKELIERAVVVPAPGLSLPGVGTEGTM